MRSATVDAVGLTWRECSLPQEDYPDGLDWKQAEDCFGHPIPVRSDTEKENLGGRIDHYNLQLTIGQDTYQTDVDEGILPRQRYTLYKNGDHLKSLRGEFGAYPPNISLQNVGGKVAWEFADPHRATIVYDGHDLRRLYGLDRAYRPYSLADKLIFIGQKDGKYFVVYDGLKVGPDFDEIILAFCCETALYSVHFGQGRYLFWGTREGRPYIVEITSATPIPALPYAVDNDTLSETYVPFNDANLDLSLRIPLGWETDMAPGAATYFYNQDRTGTRKSVLTLSVLSPGSSTLESALEEVNQGAWGPYIEAVRPVQLGAFEALRLELTLGEDRPPVIWLVVAPSGRAVGVIPLAGLAPVETVLSTLRPARAEASAWLVYTSDEFDIQLRYPPTFFLVENESTNDATLWEWNVNFFDKRYQQEHPPQTPGIWIHAYPNPEGTSLDGWLASHSTSTPFGTKVDLASPVYYLWPDEPIQKIAVAGHEGRSFTSDAMGLRIPTVLLPHEGWILDIAFGDFGPDDLQSIFAAMLETLELHPVTEPSDGGATCVTIPEVLVEVCFPDNYLLLKNAETNRRGSFVSYDFRPLSGYETPYLKELQFFSEASIAEFTRDCDESTPCFFGDYPDLDRYRGQREALRMLTSYQDFELQSFNGRPFLVVNRPCYGDDCVIREYTTFLGDVKLDIWIVMADESEIERGDQLLTQLIIKGSP
jgi:hypothetical protein